MFEAKQGTGRLTKPQKKAGVYNNLKTPSNTATELGGGVILNSQAKKGKFTVATSNPKKNNDIGSYGEEVNDVFFHILKY